MLPKTGFVFMTGIAITLTYGKYQITFYTCPYTEDFSIIVLALFINSCRATVKRLFLSVLNTIEITLFRITTTEQKNYTRMHI